MNDETHKAGGASLKPFPTAELEARLIYSLIVAGKSARFAERVLGLFLSGCEEGEDPLGMIARLDAAGRLDSHLRKARMGNYNKMARALRYLIENPIDLATATPEQLERAPGIGPKTSRFFILWTRPGARYAALDVHVLRWLGEHGYDVPRSTPTGERYAHLERAFLAEADALGLTARQLDARIWDAASGTG